MADIKNGRGAPFWLPLLFSVAFGTGSLVYAITRESVRRDVDKNAEMILKVNEQGTQGLRELRAELKPTLEMLVSDVKELKDSQQIMKMDLAIVKREVLK